MNRNLSIPVYGKMYIISSVVLSLMVFSTSVNPYNLSYVFSSTVFELGLWRPFTAGLYMSRVGILLPFHVVFAVVAFHKMGMMFGDRKADFTWFFILSMCSLAIFSTFSGLYFYGNSFVMLLLTMWAMQHSGDSFAYQSIRIPSIYFPLMYATVMILLGSAFKNYMAGFLFGLLLGIIKSRSYVDKYGDLFPTPAFLTNFFQEG